MEKGEDFVGRNEDEGEEEAINAIYLLLLLLLFVAYHSKCFLSFLLPLPLPERGNFLSRKGER